MKKYHWIVVVISALVIFLNNLPLIWGLTNPKEGLVFLGRRDINSQDLYTYVSFIEQGKRGRFLFENLYQSEPQKQRLLRPSYILIGKAAWLFDISSIWAYHLARLVLIFAFFFVLWRFVSLFFTEAFKRIAAYTLILTSSGIGFAVARFAGSTDTWVPESVTFLALQEAPHFILAQILMIGGFLFYLKGLGENSIKMYILASISFLLLSFEHPFNLGIVAAAIFTASLWLFALKRHKVKYLLKGLFIVVPVLLIGVGYQIFEVFQNPVLTSWASQNKLLSPDPLHWLLGYGLLLILATLGAEKFLQEKSTTQILALSWIFSTALLLYSPIFFQRRFSEGLHIPISIMAAAGIFVAIPALSKFVVSSYRRLFQNIILVAIFLILALSSFAIVIGDINIINSDSGVYYYYHLTRGEIEGIGKLREKTNGKDVILANWFYGNLIPGLTGRKVYIGHKVQTPFFDQKVAKINRFLLNKNSKEARQFLKDNGITYIFLGRNDSMLEYGFKPFEKPYLTDVYNKDDVLIFKVE